MFQAILHKLIIDSIINLSFLNNHLYSIINFIFIIVMTKSIFLIDSFSVSISKSYFHFHSLNQ